MKQWLLIIAAFALSVPGYAVKIDFGLELGAEGFLFPMSPAFTGQGNYDVSASIRPKYSIQWDRGTQIVDFSPFFRWDKADKRRTHFDITELSYLNAWDGFEFRVGIRKVYWGVTESQHLVDIVNQIDLVEDYTGRTKLGQPMVSGAFLTSVGNFELFIMPYFRERTYAGAGGRFRGETLIDTDKPTYESPHGKWNPDSAFRYSTRLGVADIGLSHFFGTSRQPTFEKDPVTQNLNPHYPTINQSGLDLQLTTGPMLWKVESIVRGDKSFGDIYVAGTAGGEYTFGQVADAFDLGILLEYLYDSRQNQLLAYSDDIYLGVRFSLNDKDGLTFLAGSIWDRKQNNQAFLVEANRRWEGAWKTALKGGYFHMASPPNPLSSFSRDAYIQFELTYFISR